MVQLLSRMKYVALIERNMSRVKYPNLNYGSQNSPELKQVKISKKMKTAFIFFIFSSTQHYLKKPKKTIAYVNIPLILRKSGQKLIVERREIKKRTTLMWA